MSFIIELLLVYINDESAMNGPDSLKPLLVRSVLISMPERMDLYPL